MYKVSKLSQRSGFPSLNFFKVEQVSTYKKCWTPINIFFSYRLAYAGQIGTSDQLRYLHQHSLLYYATKPIDNLLKIKSKIKYITLNSNNTLYPMYCKLLKKINSFLINLNRQKKLRFVNSILIGSLPNQVVEEVSNLVHGLFYTIYYLLTIIKIQTNLKINPNKFWKFINSKRKNNFLPNCMCLNTVEFNTPNDIINSSLHSCSINLFEEFEALGSLISNSSSGPDLIPNIFLRESYKENWNSFNIQLKHRKFVSSLKIHTSKPRGLYDIFEPLGLGNCSYAPPLHCQCS
ncbi:hypothetical protein QTP88_026325 [Uroleucon formosanum]